MQHHYSMTDHKGADMPARFYIDGVRVSREKFEDIKDRGHREGRVNCFHTSGREIAGGKTRRTNHCTVQF